MMNVRSHVKQWGQQDWTDEPIGVFEGAVDQATDKGVWDWIAGQGMNTINQWDKSTAEQKSNFAIGAHDIKLQYLYNWVMREPTPENHQALMDEINYRMMVDETFKTLNPNYTVGEEHSNIDFDCYRELIGEFEAACFKLEDYSLKYAGQLVHEC